MKRMTSEIIANLQKCVDKYGDLPFQISDSDNGCGYFDVTVFANTLENGGCCDPDDIPAIGISF